MRIVVFYSFFCICTETADAVFMSLKSAQGKTLTIHADFKRNRVICRYAIEIIRTVCRYGYPVIAGQLSLFFRCNADVCSFIKLTESYGFTIDKIQVAVGISGNISRTGNIHIAVIDNTFCITGNAAAVHFKCSIIYNCGIFTCKSTVIYYKSSIVCNFNMKGAFI